MNPETGILVVNALSALLNLTIRMIQANEKYGEKEGTNPELEEAYANLELSIELAHELLGDE